MANSKRKAVWDRPPPQKAHTTLSPAKKSSAKASAKRAGRPYPNLIDNMRAAKNKSVKRKVVKPKAAKQKRA